MEPSRILVVDDNPDVRLLVRIALRSEPAVVVDEADGGCSAIAKIEEHCPDLLILDLMMPDMDGFEVCRRVRSNPASARLPVVLLTALADAKSRADGFLAGADHFIVKPFRNADLRTCVRGLLQRPRAEIAAGSGAAQPRSSAL